jgi:hypothetical protein
MHLKNRPVSSFRAALDLDLDFGGQADSTARNGQGRKAGVETNKVGQSPAQPIRPRGSANRNLRSPLGK